MSDDKIIPLYDYRFVSCINCPDCGSDNWLVMVDQVKSFDYFIGFRCSNEECNFHVPFKVHKDILLGELNEVDELNESLNQGSTDSENPTDSSKPKEE